MLVQIVTYLAMYRTYIQHIYRHAHILYVLSSMRILSRTHMGCPIYAYTHVGVPICI